MKSTITKSLTGSLVAVGLLAAMQSADAAMLIYESPNTNSPTQGGYYEAYVGASGGGVSFSSLPPRFVPGAFWLQGQSLISVPIPQFTASGFAIEASHTLFYGSGNPANSKVAGFLYFKVDVPTDITFTGNFQGTSVGETGIGGSTLAISLVTLNPTTELETVVSQKSSNLLTASLNITATLMPDVIYGVKFSEIVARSRMGTGSIGGSSSFSLTTAAAVPEPASLGIMAVSALTLLTRRRK